MTSDATSGTPNIPRNHYSTIVIGAGPAGLMAALTAAPSTGENVCLLEKNDVPGKKLLLAGSGRCNLTNAGPIANFPGHYGGHARFVKPALYHFTNVDLAEFMSCLGLPLKELNDSKLFPVTESGRDVLRVLLDACERSGVNILYHSAVKRAVKGTNDGGFLVQTESGSYTTRKLVIATGGKSYPSTGSTGDGFLLARSFGHTISEVAPALTPVIVQDYPFGDCAGTSFAMAGIRVTRHGKKQAERKGALLLTHQGLSGPGILDLSRDIQPGDTLTVSFVNFSSPEAFEDRLLSDFRSQGKKTIKNILSPAYLPERFTVVLGHHRKIDMDQTAATLEKEVRKKLVEAITGMPLTVERLGDFHEAMATRGGVSLSEIHRNTLESRLVPGLFFCGEVLDVDGDTGGYNLQFAFSSGALVGKHGKQTRLVGSDKSSTM